MLFVISCKRLDLLIKSQKLKASYGACDMMGIMPRWRVYEVLGELCGIPRSIMWSINEFLDIGHDHDKGRLIVYGHWDPKELHSLAASVYRRWGVEGVKAALHHHIMDYVCTLLTKLKYGKLVRHIIDEVMKRGLAVVYEDVETGQVYMSSNITSKTLRMRYLRKEDVTGYIQDALLPMLDQVLKLIDRDFRAKSDEVSELLTQLARKLKLCIRESANKLIKLHIDALLRKEESPCKTKITEISEIKDH